MATPIAPTPTLRGKAARDFTRKIEKEQYDLVGLVPTPKLDIQKIREKISNEVNKKRIAPNPMPRYDDVYYDAATVIEEINS